MIVMLQSIAGLLRIATDIAGVVRINCWQNGVEDVDKVDCYPRR